MKFIGLDGALCKRGLLWSSFGRMPFWPPPITRESSEIRTRVLGVGIQHLHNWATVTATQPWLLLSHNLLLATTVPVTYCGIGTWDSGVEPLMKLDKYLEKYDYRTN